MLCVQNGSRGDADAGRALRVSATATIWYFNGRTRDWSVAGQAEEEVGDENEDDDDGRDDDDDDEQVLVFVILGWWMRDGRLFVLLRSFFCCIFVFFVGCLYLSFFPLLYRVHSTIGRDVDIVQLSLSEL